MSTNEHTQGSVWRSAGAQLTAVLAVIYGVGVAFGPQVWDHDGFWQAWLAVGAAVVGLSFVWTIVLPLARGTR